MVLLLRFANSRLTGKSAGVQKLPIEDQRYLDAALGWAMLGNLTEVNAELAEVTPAHRNHPDALKIQLEIQAETKQWEASLATAECLIKVLPDDSCGWIRRSYALHELKRSQEAFDLLLDCLDTFPKDCTIPYNLSCYLAQLGRLEEAWKMLEHAFGVGDKQTLRLQALRDPDLQPIWMEIIKKM